MPNPDQVQLKVNEARGGVKRLKEAVATRAQVQRVQDGDDELTLLGQIALHLAEAIEALAGELQGHRDRHAAGRGR
jgi:hypothetical protein